MEKPMPDDSINLHPAKQILQSASVGSLATLSAKGSPFVTLVTVANTSPTQLVMLLSGLARHTKNLDSNRQCSLLLVQQGGEGGNPLEGARLTLVGEVAKLSREQDTAEREAFLAVHPDAAMYANFGDFSIYRMDIREAHLVAGFGRIETLSAEQLSA
jgi:putative heme iron utilization protein